MRLLAPVIVALLGVACGADEPAEGAASAEAEATSPAPTEATKDESAPSLPPLAVPDPTLLVPETLRYQIRVEAGEAHVEGTSRREVTREQGELGDVWRVATTTDVGPGSLDEFVLDAATLSPIRREASDGSNRLVLEFAEDAISGELRMQEAEPVKIAVPLDAPVSADTSALEWVMTSWPLAIGYAATVRTFDARNNRVHVWRFLVSETEDVEVPAGSFSAYKVRMLPADGTPGLATLWISQSPPRRLLRSETALPGTLIRAELTEIAGG